MLNGCSSDERLLWKLHDADKFAITSTTHNSYSKVINYTTKHLICE